MSNNKGIKIITIASGKGGVGKTNISLNLAMAVLERESSVCLVDADLGCANIDILLGISPEYSLADYIEGKNRLEDIIAEGPKSLKIIPGGSALDSIPNPNGHNRERLSMLLDYLKDYDSLIIDASAGISDQILFFLEAASHPVIVLVPEPTSLTDAYGLLKSYNLKGNKGPVYILINQVESQKQAKRIFKKFKQAVDRHLNVNIRSMGFILADPGVGEAVSRQIPFISLFPDAPASRCVKFIARAVVSSNSSIRDADFERLFDLGEHDPEEQGGSLLPDDNEPEEKIADGHRDAPTKDTYGEIIDLLIKEDLLTPSQVEYAIKVRAKLDNPKTLLDTLKDLGNVREKQIRETLYKNRTGFRIGSLLVELGYITEKQLSMALNEQKENDSKRRLGEILIDSNYITEYDLTQVLSLTLGIPYMEPHREMLDMARLEKASTQFFLKHRFLPVKSGDGRASITMADPLDATALESIKNLYGKDFQVSISMGKYIDELIEFYDTSKRRSKIVRSDENQIVRIVDDIINDALDKHASDIHLEPLKGRLRVRFRRDGSLIQHLDLSKDLEASIISRIKIMASANITEKRRHQDGRILMNSTRSGEEIDQW